MKKEEVNRDPSPHVMDRVKELESVNEKIKQMLANKREPLVSAIQTRQPSHYKRSEQPNAVATKTDNATPKKMTSLFQDEKAIVESKVSKERKNFDFDEYKAISKEKDHAVAKVEESKSVRHQ